MNMCATAELLALLLLGLMVRLRYRAAVRSIAADAAVLLSVLVSGVRRTSSGPKLDK